MSIARQLARLSLLAWSFAPLANPVLADDKPMAGASQAAGAPSSDASTTADQAGGATLLGDMGGIRPALEHHGVSLGVSETTETLGNAWGGFKRGAIVEGLTQMSVGVDLGKALGIDGGIFNASALQIHGRGLSATAIGNLDIVSSIEADPSTRLNELWVQQSFLGGKLDVKIGQQSGDLEFITSEYEDLFINSGFGWPTLPAVDLPSGGPAYPLPTPAIRLRAKPNDAVVALLGLYDGSPAGLRPGDPQVNDPSGTNFDVSSGYLVIGEVQYLVDRGKDAKGLPATYKLGAWYDSNRVQDPFFSGGATAEGDDLAPAGGSRRGDWSIYGTLDQLVYRPSGTGDGGLAVTARVMGAPSDRNLVDVFAQGGVTYKGAFGRADDTMGVGAEWARVSPRARAGDRAAAATLTGPYPVRDGEAVVEATYQAQIAPWWQVQPDVQYVVSPGGGIPDPNRPGHRIGDTLVLGVRSVVTF